MFSQFTLVSGIIICQLRGAFCSTLAPHESVSSLPRGWTLHGPANARDSIMLDLALVHPHEDYLQLAYNISNPDSAQYGHHLSPMQLSDVLPNYQEQSQKVSNWLRYAGIGEVHGHREWMTIRTSVGEANSLFNANFSYYKYHGSEPYLRTMSYSIPHHLEQSIDFVYPTVHFLGIRAPGKNSILSKRQGIPPTIVNCTNSVCPKTIQERYNINYTPPDSSSGSSVGVTGYLEQYINHTDVDTFLKKFGLPNQTLPYQFSVDNVGNVQNDQSDPGLEASLDVEYVMAFTELLNVTFFSTPGRPPTLGNRGKPIPPAKSQNEPYIAFLQYLSELQSPPQVISSSYSDTESTVPLRYAQRVCNMYGRLALRGISAIHASGDGGATGTRADPACLAPDGKSHRFEPTFPASCPWVTSVGATMQASSPPYAASYTSGGFSNYFPTPSFQESAVSAYQKLIKKPAGFYNETGRGVPDVSLVGDDFAVVVAGFSGQVSGTSAATPVFAAMIALINDKRLRNGKNVLGHLNPLLYSSAMSASFTDVTRGISDGCVYKQNGTDVSVSGFPAKKGWDAVSGLGEPDFAKVLGTLGD